MIQVYHETARMTWYQKPRDEVVKSSRTADVKDPLGKQDDAVRDESQDEDIDSKNKFGVRLESNEEEEAQEASSTDSNDFDIIV